MAGMAGTHAVTNQPPPLVGYDVLGSDPALTAAVARWAPDAAPAALAELRDLGLLAGGALAQDWAEAANTYPPQLRTHDRYGHRVDEVGYHPAYHSLMDTAVRHGLHAAPWADRRPGAHVVRAAGFLVWSQTDAGHGCPISMTYAAVPALRAPGVDPALAAQWIPRLVARSYDSALHPGKVSALAGMAMTEKQGGSDVRTGTTRAVATDEPGVYALTGHKWFCSAPMSDLFLVLAQAPGGLSCFAVPRLLPDGSRNPFALQRLKDKLGNRSNASSEVEFEATLGWLVGPEGRGVATITQMKRHPARLRHRLRPWHAPGPHPGGPPHPAPQRVRQPARRPAAHGQRAGRPRPRLRGRDAARHAARPRGRRRRAGAAPHRHRGGQVRRLQGRTPLRRRGAGVPRRQRLRRGVGPAAALPRGAAGGIWEGSGNVNALDVLRVLGREPDTVEALRAEIAYAAGGDPRLDAATYRLDEDLLGADESGARRLVGRLHAVLAGALMVRFASPAAADAYCATRQGGDGGSSYGTLPSGVDTAAIVSAAAPEV